MNSDPNDILQRFHRILVREIQASNPEHLNAPFSVAEIYQNLVPYRTHRDEIGVEMNADYEHALLRLLAGEEDYLTIESGTARQEIREELDSPNPNTGLFRDFAAADVRLNPEMIGEALMWDPGEETDAQGEDAFEGEVTAESGDSELEDVVGPEDSIPEAETPEVEFSEEEETGVEEEDMEEEFAQTMDGEDEGSVGGALDADGGKDGEVDSGELPSELSGQEVPWPPVVDLGDGEEIVIPEGAPAAEEAGAETCAWCRETLPQRSGVNFCPFCGCSVHLVPCPECGEELEPTWRFCIACGMEVSS